MTYYEFKPNPILSPYLQCFWFFDSFEKDYTSKILPDNCVDIILDFSDKGSCQKAFVTGMMTKPIISSRTKLLALRFKAEAAYSFLGLPLSEITDQTVDLKELLPQKDYLKL